MKFLLPGHEILLLPLMLLSFLSLGGCGADPASPDTDTTVRALHVGDSFTMEGFDVDGNGTKIAGTERVKTLTVGTTGLSVFGRTDVVGLGAGYFADSMLIVQEPNGDLTMLVLGQTNTHSGIDHIQSPTLWVTYPFGGRTGKILVVDFDTTAELNGNMASFSVRHTVEYAGSEEVRVGSETFTAEKVTEEIRRVDGDDAGDHEATHISTFWYAPKLGFFVRIDGARTDDSGNDDRWRFILTNHAP